MFKQDYICKNKIIIINTLLSAQCKSILYSYAIVSQSALDNLKDIAHKRTDIFGGIEAETSTQVQYYDEYIYNTLCLISQQRYNLQYHLSCLFRSKLPTNNLLSSVF